MPWQQICLTCNALYQDKNSWWQPIAHDPQIVPRVDKHSIALRLGGIEFMILEPRGTGIHARLAPEFLLRTHVGSRFVLTHEHLSPEPLFVSSLDELGLHYALVRRRVLAHSQRHQAVLDRLFLRHRHILAVAIPFSIGLIDFSILTPQGLCFLYLLRPYNHPALHSQGPNSIVHYQQSINHWLTKDHQGQKEVQELLKRTQALQGPWSTRLASQLSQITLYPRIRLIIYDFDQAQRQLGLSTLLTNLENNQDQVTRLALDPNGWSGDIFTIGDPGNITGKILRR